MVRSKSPRYFNVLGEPVAQRTVCLWGALVFLVIGSIVGLLYYVLLQGSAPIVAAPSPSVSVEAALDAPAASPTVVSELMASDRVESSAKLVSQSSSLVHLLEKHLEATQLGDLDSLIASGTAKAAMAAAVIQNCEVTLIGRRPNLYKLKTEVDGDNYFSQFGYDGKHGWFQGDLAKLKVTEVEFFMLVALFESSVAHLAWSYQSDAALEFGLDSVLERLPDEQWQGRTCAVVMSRSLFPFPMYHYIDQDSYEEVYRRAELLRGSEQVAIELHFVRSPVEPSPRIPMGYQLYFAGELNDTVEYTKVRSNRLMLSKLFDAPTDASVTGLFPR